MVEPRLVIPFRPFSFEREWFGPKYKDVKALGMAHPEMQELVEALRSLPPIQPQVAPRGVRDIRRRFRT